MSDGRWVNVADFERAAAEKLEAGVLGYFAGGAGDEVTLGTTSRLGGVGGCGRGCWPRWRVQTWAEVLGAEVSMPVLVAPVAYQRLVDPDGELGDGAGRRRRRGR